MSIGFVFLVLTACFSPKQNASTAPVTTTQEPTDPFLWLEEVEGERSLNWVKAQNKRSLDVFENDKRYKQLLLEAETNLNAKDRIPYAQLHANKVNNTWRDDKHVRGLWRTTTLRQYRTENPTWETVLDFDELANKENKNWVYKGRTCLQPKRQHCMLRLSDGGKDAATYREFDSKSKSFVDAGFVIPESKTSVSWIDKDNLLVSTNWGEGTLSKSGYPLIVKHVKRGASLDQAKTIYQGQPDDMGVWPYNINTPEKNISLLRRSINFYSGEYMYLKEDGTQLLIPIPKSARLQAYFKGQFIFSLRKPWEVQGQKYTEGTVLSFSENEWLKSQKLPALQVLAVPGERTSFVGISTTKSALLLSKINNVKGELLQYSWDKKWTSKVIPLPKTGTLYVVSANPYQDEVFINYEDFITADQLYEYHTGNGTLKVIKSNPPRFDASQLVVKQHETTSKDGVKIPYFLIHRKNMPLNGSTPTILYGYGGFEISLRPSYSSTRGKLWLERGGAYAIANIRGGGEFGPKWHQAARKQNRQRAFDDFIAVGEDLVNKKVTTSKRLGIVGGSNGGLLVGAAFTQRPDLFNAVVCAVPLLDMLRYTQLLAGASWAAEYGDPKDPKMRAVLQKYSPYHNVHAEKKYPEVFFVTSTKDDRVHPAHARKMVAKMTDQGQKVYYYENIEGGHSAASNLKQAARRGALQYTYLAMKLGLPLEGLR